SYAHYNLLQSFESQLIAGLGERLSDSATGQLQNRVRGQAGGDPPRDHVRAYLPYSFVTIQKHNVNCELHSETVNRLARDNPQPLPCLESRVFQKSSTPLRAGIGNLDRFRQHSLARHIANPNLQFQRYNTVRTTYVAVSVRLFAGGGRRGTNFIVRP